MWLCFFLFIFCYCFIVNTTTEWGCLKIIIYMILINHKVSTSRFPCFSRQRPVLIPSNHPLSFSVLSKWCQTFNLLSKRPRSISFMLLASRSIAPNCLKNPNTHPIKTLAAPNYLYICPFSIVGKAIASMKIALWLQTLNLRNQSYSQIFENYEYTSFEQINLYDFLTSNHIYKHICS